MGPKTKQIHILLTTYSHCIPGCLSYSQFITEGIDCSIIVPSNCISTQVSACSLAQISKPKNHPVASLKVTRSCKEEQTEDLKNELKLELIHSVDYILMEISLKLDILIT
ncbi:hypothetical protein CK203_063880 [Vitis vinifera]|uniref:Uncharacterized protein n=1 Tax=Vitis vinifera TaxID=29760 RepID=A0A438G4H3_VITVI|nr:hypothetical protein CK203_063880 [Vitis vinifera]